MQLQDNASRQADSFRRLQQQFGRRPRTETRRRSAVQEPTPTLPRGARLGGFLSIPIVPPKSPLDAPTAIFLRLDVSTAIEGLWTAMISQGERNGFDVEWGAVLVSDGVNLTIENKHAGTAEGPNIDRNVSGSGRKAIGTVHTHPDPDQWGFSGADVANMVNKGDLAAIVVFGLGKESLMLRTEQTTINALSQVELQKSQAARVEALRKQGLTREWALRTTNIEMAGKYGLAYYEKTAFGFQRIVP